MRVPSGSTTIWLPIVKTFWAVIASGGDHVAPPSVVFEKYGAPRKANECRIPLRLRRSLRKPPRSHTTYAVPAWNGSAVSDSLSLIVVEGEVSVRTTVVGSLQVAPPSVDVLASTAD